MKLPTENGHSMNGWTALRIRQPFRIVARLNRVALGHLGDVKPVGAEVSELRLAFGKGYRVYFAQERDKIILLLCGGDKGSQDRDIREAKTYLQDYRRRDHGKKK